MTLGAELGKEGQIVICGLKGGKDRGVFPIRIINFYSVFSLY